MCDGDFSVSAEGPSGTKSPERESSRKGIPLAVKIAVPCWLLLIGVGTVGIWGWNIFVDQAKVAIGRNPIALQHIGDIQKIESDFLATGEAEDVDTFVFRVQGTKGSGTVTAQFVSVDTGMEEIVSGTLRLASGETYRLIPED